MYILKAFLTKVWKVNRLGEDLISDTLSKPLSSHLVYVITLNSIAGVIFLFPDLTPCDFLWGIFQYRVYVNRPRTPQELKAMSYVVCYSIFILKLVGKCN